MVGLSLKIGMETKQIFSVQPSPKQEEKDRL